MLRNKGKRTVLAAVLAAALVIFPATAVSTYAADSSIIHEEIQSQTITQGVTLDHIIKFTTHGWYNFNIMKVDLTNPYISVDALTNTDSVGKLASVEKMAQQRNAVAAVNAGFFSWEGGVNGRPIGITVENSNILNAASDFNKYSDSIASISVSKLNEVLYNIWKADISLTSQNGAKVHVAQYNESSLSKYNYTDITVFDRKWSTTAVGATADMPDIVQMVVADGKVTEFLTGQPAAEIPENGYIVVTRSAGAKTLQQAFAVGDSITLNIVTNPDWNNLKASVPGCCQIVKNGAIPTQFSYAPSDVVKASPKTAIGSSQDGKMLLLVTVDGRQTASVGLTLKEMASFMRSLGAYNAINMDGGGSTTFVARPEGDTETEVMNRPSDGSLRSIATAFGVFTSAPAGELAGLILEPTDQYVFNNTSRTINVKGYDTYHNPMSVTPSAIQWSVSGVKGRFKGNVFYPTTYGEGKITAKAGNIKATTSISVLSAPAKIMLSSKSLKLPVGKTETFYIIGVNKNGYRAPIDHTDVKWSVKNNIGTFSNGVFKATERGAGYIAAAVGNTQAYCTISVSSDTTTVLDPFETVSATYLSSPSTTSGAFEISPDQKVSGDFSGKLTYDFTNTQGTRAAYAVLTGSGITLGQDLSKIGLEVYNDHENSGWLRVEIKDANGAKQILDLAKAMDWTGWKHLEVSLENIKLPARLTRIYLAQIHPVADTGSIYLDDLTATNSGYPSIDNIVLPPDTMPADETNKAVSFGKATADSFRFGVLGQSRAPKNALEKKLVTRFAQKVDSPLEIGAVVGNNSHESVIRNVRKNPLLATSSIDLKITKAQDNRYSVKDIKNSRFIKLDTRSGGLRRSDTDQWGQFLNDLNSFKGKNVFLFMQSSPDNFSDKLELDLLKETLSDYRLKTGRNVWVFYNGAKNEAYNENGVKYISTVGCEVPGLTASKTDDAQYVLVTVKGSVVTYIFRPIL